ncbi:SGNH/GDSL hydrolase family protein [Kineosporia succinea]|uniref:Lysophospholipase L1-like esterase n=1 Tax=Kineosporia succinea TaxID=84632 RepID=A0ABT9P9Q9_9ACTN|nr:GDSL-type esterase/lipase family protein [Kineosporia succinea]MDP9829436.1 lysophospholipase L1-like esterase [Kineosporia succinea]
MTAPGSLVGSGVHLDPGNASVIQNAAIAAALARVISQEQLSESVDAAIQGDTRIAGSVQKSSNLADLPSAVAARNNLGLGAAATMSLPQIAASPSLAFAYTSSAAPTRLIAGRAWTFLGDSITNGANADPGVSFPYVAVSTAGGTARVANLRSPAAPGAQNPPAGGISSICGFPGEDSGQLLNRFDTDVIATKPGGVFLLAGTNDFGRNTLAQWQSNIKAIRAKVRALGIPMVIGTVPPVGSTVANASDRRAFINAQNLWLRQWAPANDVPLADTHRAMVDPATGWIRSDHNGDGIHPVNTGHIAMGKVIGPAIAAVRPPVAPLIASAGVGVNSNPLMATAGGGPTGYQALFGSTMTTPDYACVDPAAGSALAAGKWAQLDCTATQGGFTGLAKGMTGLTAGGLCALVAQVELEDISGGVAAFGTGAGGWGVSVLSDNGSVLYTGISGATNTWDPTPGPFLTMFRLPTGVTTCKIEWKVGLPTGAHVKFRLGCLDILDLTALGVNPGDL